MKKNNKKQKLKYILLLTITLNLFVINIFYKNVNVYSKIKSFSKMSGLLSNNDIDDNNADIRLEVLVDNKKADAFPDKDNYKFDDYTCSNDATINWDYDAWKAQMILTKPAVCVLKFSSNSVVNEEKNICKIVGDTYYGQNGDIVSKKEYNEQCITNPTTGRFLPYSIVFLLIVLAVIIIDITRKNNKIFKI